jgi:hypothetical protein
MFSAAEKSKPYRYPSTMLDAQCTWRVLDWVTRTTVDEMGKKGKKKFGQQMYQLFSDIEARH